MNVLEFSSTESNGKGDEGMIELLRILVKDIAVTLNLGNSGDLIDIRQQSCQGLVDRASLDVLVEITGNHDVGERVFREQRFYEGLSYFA